MTITERHARHRREHDHLGDLIDSLFPRQRGRQDDDDDDDDEEEEKPTKKAPKTITRTRYNTLEPTFTGSIAGYSTRRPKDDDETTTKTSSKAKPKSTSTAETTAAVQTTPTAAPETQLPAATESAAPVEQGMSGGAKAGIAIGAVAGVLALVGLVFLLLARKRRQKEGMRMDDEKLNGAFAPGGYAPTPAQAAAASAAAARSPGAYGAPGNHAHVSAHAPVAAGAMGGPRSPSAWERPGTSNSQSAANPFGSHAELPGSRPTTPASNGHTAVAAAVAGGIGAMAGASATRGLQRRASRNHPKQLDLTLPPPGTPAGPAGPASPARTEYSVSSVAAGQAAPVTGGAAEIAAAGGPAGSAVYRVQLDFEPTLEDELGLKAGQLVRVLHEYDDGWALCIRLDRSRQGVVPRTCLSTRPVKPRGNTSQSRAGPPISTSRPVTPKSSPPPQHSSSSRPTTPAAQSPAPRYQPMPPRPHANPPRVMSPAPGPLSAPMPAPVSATASVVSSLSPSEREPSPRLAEGPGPVLREGPGMKAEFTPLPAPVSTGPIGGLEAGPRSPAGVPLPPSPAFPPGEEAPRRKPVPGQG